MKHHPVLFRSDDASFLAIRRGVIRRRRSAAPALNAE
jgi:hypothetical protein